jgi:outer membrane protein OmpA-like peptidoglycan-associated protein
MRRAIFAFVFLVLTMAVGLSAESVVLNHVQIPERHEVQLSFAPITRIPGASVTAKVTFEERQAWIELSYDKMKPAVLFGGDVTSYVLWTVSRDGSYENLGELWVPQNKNKDTVKFSTGLRGFALMVTAEPYYQVKKPSELVITYNAPSGDPRAPSTTFEFSGFAPAPAIGFQDLSTVKYDSSSLLDLAQAQKAYELAVKLGAEDLAPVLIRDAKTALDQGRQMQSGGAKQGAGDYSRRSYALTNEAIKVTLRRLEEQELEQQLARRRAEVAAMEKRVADAESEAKSAQQQAEMAKARADESLAQAQAASAELSRTREEMEKASAEKARLEADREQLAQTLGQLRSDRAELERSMETLREEKATLSGRLQEALSKVADTQQSARGFIVNLPDILFDVNQATLKPEAALIIAKLSGILLIMQDLNLRIEGHTDSTGGAAYNLKLSQQRADSVMDFMARQGIASTRMVSVGYGMDRPVADNSTAEGRQKNRRVEIVISEGQVKEQAQ